MPEWTTSCPDWKARIASGGSLIPFEPLFPEEARWAVEDYFNELRIVDALGSPKFGKAARPWVREFTAAIFGAYDRESGRRLIREFFLLISKKNGKSTLAGGIMLTALLTNERPSAEFLILAPTLEVANNAFYPIRDMVRAEPDLETVLHVQDHLKMVTHRDTGAMLKVVAADSATVSGKKATGVLVDELWEFGKRASAENMLREATGGLVSRPEGFVIYLSTQSDEPPAGIFKKKLDYFRGIRDGLVEDKRSLPVLYEFPKEMEDAKAYLDPANFWITNPNLGASVDEEWIREKLTEAQLSGEESVRGFVAKHLNVEIGLALRADRWAGAVLWEDAVEPAMTLERLLDCSDAVTIGIDGGGLDDLLSLYVIGRETAPDQDVRFRRWFGWGHSWAFSDPVKRSGVLQRRQSEASKLQDFASAGELTIFNRMGDDIEGMVAIIKKIYETGLLAAVGLDPVGVGSVVDAINDAGIVLRRGNDDMIVAVSQGYKLMGAIKTAERKLADKTLVPANQAIMAWAVSNARNEQKGNAMMITKQASGTAKIDPLMAMFDAVSLMATNPESTKQWSVYDVGENGIPDGPTPAAVVMRGRPSIFDAEWK